MALTWTAQPARRRPDQIALVAAVVLLSSWAVLVTLGSAYLAILAALLLIAAIAPFWLPTRYRLDDDGVEERRWPRRRFRPWTELRRLEIGPAGALVSPFAHRHRLDRFRGLVVYFDGGPRDQIVEALRARLPEGERAVTDAEPPLSDADRALLDELADAIAKRRLISPAIFFLESVKPIGFVGSQTMLLLRPLISLVWSSPTRWDQVQRVLEVRGSIELLLRRLEARA